MKTLLTVGVLGFLLVAAVAYGLYTWNLGEEQVPISTPGLIALVLGSLGTLALGGGLMFLLFYSARHGYDDAVDDPTARTPDDTDRERRKHTVHGAHGTWTRYDDPPSG
jgi:hypothetical protein